MTADTLDTNLLSSGRKRANAEANTPPPVTRSKKIFKFLGYSSLFLSFFLFFIFLKLPSSLLQSLIMGALNQPGNPLQWQADQVKITFFPLPGISLTSLSTPGNFQIPPLSFDEITLRPSFLSLIPITGSFSPSIGFQGKAYQFSFEGTVSPLNSPSLVLKAKDVDLMKLGPLREKGIELQGVLSEIDIDVSLPQNRLSQAEGKIAIKGKNFLVDPAALSLPVPLPILDTGAIQVEASILNGRASLRNSSLGAPGKDIQLFANGDIQLNDRMENSKVDLRLRLKISDKIFTAMPALRQMLNTLATQQPDGFYAMKTSGTLERMNLPVPDR